MHISLSFILLLVFKYNVNFIYKLKIGEMTNSFPQIQYMLRLNINFSIVSVF